MAVEKENAEIVKILLTNDKLDPNIPFILILIYFIKFKTIFFNYIQKFKYSYNSNLQFLIEFPFKYFNGIQSNVFLYNLKTFFNEIINYIF